VVSLGLGLSLFGRPALRVIADPAYYSAANLIPFVVTAFIFQSWGSVVQFGIDAAERTKYATLVIWISAGVVAVLYALLIPPFGAYGAAAATVTAFGTRTWLLNHFAGKVWPLTYDWARQFRVMSVAVTLCILAWVLPSGGFLRETIVATVLFSVFAIYVWSLELSGDLRSAVLRRLRRITSFHKRRMVPA
jgi:O-antigen/teichoic acid export membrane protein